MSSDEICCVHVPELRLAIPQNLVEKMEGIPTNVSLVLTIPTELSQGVVDGNRRFVGLKMRELEVNWKVSLTPATVETGADIQRIPTEVRTEAAHASQEDDSFVTARGNDTSADTVIMSDSEMEMQSQSIL